MRLCWRAELIRPYCRHTSLRAPALVHATRRVWGQVFEASAITPWPAMILKLFALAPPTPWPWPFSSFLLESESASDRTSANMKGATLECPSFPPLASPHLVQLRSALGCLPTGALRVMLLDTGVPGRPEDDTPSRSHVSTGCNVSLTRML